ncbi:MAG: HAD-IIIA family hydrolase [Pseudomonadota bacterium]|nr:HAD-IIIA family hydrolase [Pseudomonadota bacterium]
MMQTVQAKAASVRLVVMDVDGVLTDGKVTYTSTGEELKSFTTQDGQALKLLEKAGIRTAIITGRQSPMVARRAKELGIDHVYQGNDKKIVLLKNLLAELNLSPEEVAYIGDDLPDLAPIKWVGLGIAPANARALLKEHADWVVEKRGGEAVMVDVVDLLLQAQGVWNDVMAEYLLAE